MLLGLGFISSDTTTDSDKKTEIEMKKLKEKKSQ